MGLSFAHILIGYIGVTWLPSLQGILGSAQEEEESEYEKHRVFTCVCAQLPGAVPACGSS